MSNVVELTRAPGVYYDLPAAEYFGGPGLSRSQLLHLAKSPAHFFGMVLDPDRPPPEEPTTAQRVGTLMHCQMFEPHNFPMRFPIGPDVKRNTKIWKDFEARLMLGQTGIKADEAEAARRQVASVLKLRDVAEAMSIGKGEVSVYWNEPVLVDEETGEVEQVLCRARIDWVHPIGDGSRAILIDGKTCGDSSPGGFEVEIRKHRYDIQDAFYRDGFEKASGMVVDEFVFAQVEGSWPYVPGCCFVTPAAVEAARNEYRALLRLYVACKRKNHWPPYSEGISMVDPRPRWKRD